MNRESLNAPPPVFAGRRASVLTRLRLEARRPGAYLVPLRIFIGLGWLRAAAEKLVDPSWMSGVAVETFWGAQIGVGAVVFPTFETIGAAVIDRAAPTVAWVVLVLQIACGIAILLGAYTNAALLAGMGMNIVFMLAGRPTPSVFYFLIQVVLFVAGAGAILGFDSRQRGRARSILRVSSQRHGGRGDRWWLAAIAGLLTAISIYAFLHATNMSPGGSVRDPAVVLGVATGLGALSFLIAVLAHGQRRSADPDPGAEQVPNISQGATP